MRSLVSSRLGAVRGFAWRARSSRSELIDGSDYSPEEYACCLRQLEWINGWTNAYGPTLDALVRFAFRDGDEHEDETRVLRILDVGCGHGDMLRRIARWASGWGVNVDLTGIDIQPRAVELAVKSTPDEMRVRYLVDDVFRHVPNRPYDVILNSLVAHHFDDDALVELLRWMSANATRGFFINDLHRHPLPYAFIGVFTRLLGFNRLIQHDAPLSVARGFLAREWRELGRRAGLDPSRLEIRWHWAFRLGVRYERAL